MRKRNGGRLARRRKKTRAAARSELVPATSRVADDVAQVVVEFVCRRCGELTCLEAGAFGGLAVPAEMLKELEMQVLEQAKAKLCSGCGWRS